MSDKSLAMSILKDRFSVCRMEPDTPIPEWALEGRFIAVTRTEEELSVVCRQDNVPDSIQCQMGWKALKVEGPLDFSLTGILSSISTILAQAVISIFAVSTYDTDYILIRENDLERAVSVLRSAGYKIV